MKFRYLLAVTLFGFIASIVSIDKSANAFDGNFIVETNPNLLTDAIVKYLTEPRGEKPAYFPNGVKPSDITMLKLTESEFNEVKSAPYGKEFLAKDNFIYGQYNFIAQTSEGKRLFRFRNDKRLHDSELTDEQAGIIKRLYNHKYIAIPDYAPDEEQPEDFTGLLPEETTEETQKTLAELLKRKKGRQLLDEFYFLTKVLKPEQVKYAVHVLKHMDKTGFANRNRERFYDADYIPAGAFYENVLYAVKAYQEFKWNFELTEELFMDYVLIHAQAQCQSFRWRARCYDAFAPVVKNMKTVEEAIHYINIIAAKMLRYRYDLFFEDQGLLTLLASHEGRCEEMVIITNYFLRSVNIPVSHVYTPAWGRGDGNHAWCGAYKGDKLLSFMGCEPGRVPNFESYKGRGAGKVYAVTAYGIKKDVTPLFGEVVEITLEGLKPDTPVYLNVWNHDWWRAIGAYRTDENGKVLIKNIGSSKPIWFSLSYSLTTYYKSEPYVPIHKCFIADKDKITYFDEKPIAANEIDYDFTFMTNKIKAGKKYSVQVFYQQGVDKKPQTQEDKNEKPQTKEDKKTDGDEENHLNSDKEFWATVFDVTAAKDGEFQAKFKAGKLMMLVTDEDDKPIGRPFMVVDGKIVKY